jgi:16S rRNA (cytosine1402-N4)-methyltransferase
VNYLHKSVLAEELLEKITFNEDNPLMIDCSLGEGGHSYLFLQKYPSLEIIGIDRDKAIIERAKKRLEPFEGRFRVINGWFDEVLKQDFGKKPAAILFDLGISIFHYELSERGFSFFSKDKLDMRLDVDGPLSAAHIVNKYREKELADLIYAYGEERYSRRIAKAIVDYRDKNKPIETSKELADRIYKSVVPSFRYGKIHPATRTFQALRIAVNRELDRIVPALERSVELLQDGGLIAVISFHSLEDRLVKHFFRDNGRYVDEQKEPRLQIITKKPIVPTEKEIDENSPSRSAKLRIARKRGGDYATV